MNCTHETWNPSMPSFLNEIGRIAEKIWTPPMEMAELVGKAFDETVGAPRKGLLISGETNNTTAYITLADDRILAVAPFSDLRENVLLKRWDASWADSYTEPMHVHLIEQDDRLQQLLNMPTYLLINLCVIENFPIPRLNLSIGTLAAYLRNQQLAQVKIIDMQMGHTIGHILDEALQMQPDLIGMSVNFGQKDLAFSLLDGLYEQKAKGKLHSLVVAGNVISAFSPMQFLERFPELLIADKEGEYTLDDLSFYLRGQKNLADVRGIVYLDEAGIMQKNETDTVDMRLVPTPALETMNELAEFRGALTLEASRGCDYSRCTFCPRDHKLKSWRPLTAEQTLEQVENLVRAGEVFNIKPHIYFADEEFIGELPDGKEAERVIRICEGLIAREKPISFDIAARADSVYEPKRDTDWNVERLKMWHYCKQAGVDRVFIGVESGCTKQLRRYGKGTTPEQNIIALRILSALGIQLRIGFIMFDQMMEGFDDLKENMEFLERDDALMNPIEIGDMSYEELYDKLLNDQEFINKHKKGRPVYSIVSYMLASMEVLMNAPYAKMIQIIERDRDMTLIHNDGKPDTTMGRYTIGFVDPMVGELSLAAQKWIDSNFGVMYTIKSLYKVANQTERKMLYNYMVRHRQISHFLLKYMVYTMEQDAVMDDALRKYLLSVHYLDEVMPNGLKQTFTGSVRDQATQCLNKWQQLMERLIVTIADDLAEGKLTDSHDRRLQSSLDRWLDRRSIWELINNYELS